MKMYIAVLDEVPDFMVPTLVAHSVLGAHLAMCEWSEYDEWLNTSFRKVVLTVNQKEFDKIAAIRHTYLGHENTTLDGRKSCAIPVPCENEDRPNVLKYAKMWKPKDEYPDLVWDGFQSGPYKIDVEAGGLAHLYYHGNFDEDGDPEYLQGGYLTLISIDEFKAIANKHDKEQFRKRLA